MFRKSSLKSSLGKILMLALLIALAVISVACKGSKPTSTRDVSISNIQVQSANPTLEPYVFKTPIPGSATVHGKLLLLDPSSILPAPEDPLYLVQLKEGDMTIPQLETDKAPHAEVDERTGEFIFTGIQPGQYAAVVITKGGAQFTARDFYTGDYSVFIIESNHIDAVVELGYITLP